MLRRNAKIKLGIFMMMVLGALGFVFSQEYERQVHEASVTAQIVPIFAVDVAGNPVYDLKLEEIELWVDGKSTSIIYFDGFRMDSLEAEVPSKTEVNKASNSPKIPERINFIIMDTMISNMSTMELAQLVTRAIISNASPGDAFIILESNQISGLQYVAGPTKNKDELFKGMADIQKRFESRIMYNKVMRDFAATAVTPEESQAMLDIANRTETTEKRMYEKDIRDFSRSLQQLKNALKSTTLPKTVFLISAQTRTNELDSLQVTNFRLLEEAAKSVNFGGGLFYLINPLNQGKGGNGSELKFMAEAAGGKFIAGKDTEDIVKQVKNSTSAYYELAFTIKSREGQKNAIKISCKRKGVNLTSINYTEQKRSYANMNDSERKVFLLNIVNGGSWSRMTMPVTQLQYLTLNTTPTTGPTLLNIEITIPVAIQNQKVQLFQMTIDEITQKTNFSITQKTMTAKEKLTFVQQPGKKNYFVLIDPMGSFCYYNQVI